MFSVDREGAIDRLVKLYKSVVYKTGVSKFNLFKKALKQKLAFLIVSVVSIILEKDNFLENVYLNSILF